MKLKKMIFTGALVLSISVPGIATFAQTASDSGHWLDNNTKISASLSGEDGVATAITTKIIARSGDSMEAGLQYYDGNNEYFYLGGNYSSYRASYTGGNRHARGFDSIHTSTKTESMYALHITM